MLPGPTKRTRRDGRTGTRTSARVVSVLLAVGLVAGLPGLLGATPAAAAPVPAAPASRNVVVAPPPALSLSVVAGPTGGGTTVDLSGVGVGATTRVLFGTTAVTRVTKVSSTRVRVVTPAHPAGNTPVRITTPTGTSPVSARSTFAFDPVPTISSLSSRGSSTRGGTTVTITGTGLARAGAVRFGDTAATALTRVSPTQLQVTVPAHVVGTVDVRVTTPGGTSVAAAAGRFTYTALPTTPAPTVTGLSVPAGPVLGGTVLVVSGSDFTGATSVLFGSTTVRPTVLSSTPLRVTTPAHAAGLVHVQVRTPSGTSVASAASAYSYDAVPVVTGISPASGPTAGGSTVTLTGTGLTRATAVQFGPTTTSNVVRVSATTLRVTSPARAVGTVDVRVTTPGGTSAVTTRARYTYQAPPAVTSLSTTAGPVRGGTVVTLTGTRFTGATRVDFGGTPARFTFVSATSIRATTPAHAAGVVAVTVTTPYGTSPEHTSSTFAFDPVPAITALSPQTGPPSGGTVVTLTGTGLSRATAVRFGSVAATNLVRVSATTLRATTPRHASGPVDVQVTTPGGTSATGVGARFAYGSPPVVGALSATAGPLRGGTVVTITGAHLSDATAVRFGNVAATGLVRASDTSLRVTAPAQAEGTVSVRVTNPNGTSPESAGGRF